MGMSNAERQRRFRAKKAQAGLATITLLVPAGAVPELQQLAELLRASTDYAPGPVRNVRTGKLVSLRHAQ